MAERELGEAAPVPPPVRPSLTPEDLKRSQDRARVSRARHGRRRISLLWLLVGPGMLAMLGENDGPSMLSYAASGAEYGIGFFLPFIGLTFAAAVVVQEMAMRVGAVTHRGYGELIFQRFGRTWGWIAVGDLLLTNFVTLITELIAVRVGMGFFGVPAPVAVLAGIALVVFGVSGGRYWRWERIALALALFNLVFLASAVLTHPDPGQIGHALITWTPRPTGPLQPVLLLVASDIGATITPWMVFFQQSAVADKGMTPRDIGQGRIDTILGSIVAAVAGGAAVVAAATLFTHHVDVSHYQSGAGFAQALRPLVGPLASSLFALGLVEAGALATMTISASSGYALGEALASPHSFNRGLREAKGFYSFNVLLAVLAGAVVLIPGAPLLAITLNANLLAVVLLPPTLVFLLLLANDRELMGPRSNRLWLKLLGGLIAVAVGVVGSAYAVVAAVAAIR
ncbi:MAG TPA: divalent metal cation transporter [Candidatus Nitrosotalea sp.]|nr:divalent metal cation transporter [Candidatus Nitrosotalea sp.]